MHENLLVSVVIIQQELMGMTVIGTPENIREFNYLTSSSISLIECALMNATNINATFSSVLIDLISDYLNDNTSLETFLQNGYLIKMEGNDFIVIDPETGIFRDNNIADNLFGVWSDIDYERWILGLYGTTTQLTSIELQQVANDLIIGEENFNWNKLNDLGYCALYYGMILDSVSVLQQAF